MPTSMPPITRLIILANVAVFVLELSGGAPFLARFALWPIGANFAPWQVLTYAFLHSSPGHIFFNMFAVYMFGGQMERVWGARRFAIYYAVCVMSAAVAQLIVCELMGSRQPTLGASGGVFGLLLAFALYFPRRRIVLLIPPIPMPAWLFVT
ncbi:MAG: rhomboid family intramembrane serine protease, partial [bacterium]